MNVNDSVALDMHPYFRDNHYHARQYGRVLDVYNGKAWVDWSDMGVPVGRWTPTRPESYALGCLRVVYAALEVMA